MPTEKILVSDSLQETLWRLEEVRHGFRNKSDRDVREALDWILTRQGLQRSYCNLFAPTDQDLRQGLRLLTGEPIRTNVAIRHILGEETLRAAIVWGQGSSLAVKQALGGFGQILERGARSQGTYCCYNCSIAFLRALTVVKPREWDRILEKALHKVRKARTSDGRWHGYPFYYTLLTLSELNTPLVRDELKHAEKTADRLLTRYKGNDRTSRFRELALQATLTKT